MQCIIIAKGYLKEIFNDPWLNSLFWFLFLGRNVLVVGPRNLFNLFTVTRIVLKFLSPDLAEFVKNLVTKFTKYGHTISSLSSRTNGSLTGDISFFPSFQKSFSNSVWRMNGVCLDENELILGRIWLIRSPIGLCKTSVYTLESSSLPLFDLSELWP